MVCAGLFLFLVKASFKKGDSGSFPVGQKVTGDHGATMVPTPTGNKNERDKRPAQSSKDKPGGDVYAALDRLVFPSGSDELAALIQTQLRAFQSDPESRGDRLWRMLCLRLSEHLVRSGSPAFSMDVMRRLSSEIGRESFNTTNAFGELLTSMAGAVRSAGADQSYVVELDNLNPADRSAWGGALQGALLAYSWGQESEQIPDKLSQISDPVVRAGAERFALRELLLTDQEAAISYYLGANSTVGYDPELLGSLFNANFAGEFPEESLRLVESASPGLHRDLAISQIVWNMKMYDPDKIEAWISMIQDPEVKKAARIRVAK